MKNAVLKRTLTELDRVAPDHQVALRRTDGTAVYRDYPADWLREFKRYDNSDVYEPLEKIHLPGENSDQPTDYQNDWPENSDIANAELFTKICGDRSRYVERWKTWIIWDGLRWHRDFSGARVHGLGKEVPAHLYEQASADPADPVSKEFAKAAMTLSSRARLSNMVSLARDNLLIDHNDLDADPWLLGLPDGYLDLHDGSHHPPDADKLITMSTAVDWDPTAQCPLWEKSLEDWMPDAELRDYFQRLVGASLVGKVRDHLLIFVYGTGGNGKGTAFGAIGHVLDDYYTVPHKSLIVSQKHESHDTVKASLFRTRMAVAAESDKRVKLNEAQIKELTGGDLLRARRLYENEWSFEPSHTMWLQTNHLPQVTGTDTGIWRRIQVLPWEKTFTGGSEDRELPEKLEAEGGGILRWAVEGALRWQKIGLGDDTIPPIVRQATDQYRQDEDIVGRWLEDMGYELFHLLSIRADDLVKAWTRWTEQQFGHERRFNEVADWLKSAGCKSETRRVTVEGSRSRYTVWYGVGEATPDTENDPKKDDE